MAEKRMFSKRVIDSDAFLDMPSSTQNLYFHLNMRADDDGFLDNPKKIMRIVGCKDDDLKLLIAKRYLLIFESGVIVIKHWRLHNVIRSDRKKDTLYQEEYSTLNHKKDGAYTDRQTVDGQVTDKCPHRLDKISIEEISIDKDSIVKKPDKPTKHKHGIYNHVLLTEDEYNKLINEWGPVKLLESIKRLDEGIELKGYKYKSHYLALRKWDKNNSTGKKKEFNIKDYEGGTF